MHCQGVGVIPLLGGGGIKCPRIFYPPPPHNYALSRGWCDSTTWWGGIKFPRIFYPPPPIIMHCQGVGVVPLLGGGDNIS